MSKTRIIFLGVAIGAAILAAFLAKGMLKPPAKPTTVVQKVNTVPMGEILIVKKGLVRGQEITRGSVIWQKWPKKSIRGGMITRKSDPDALQKLIGARARVKLFAGDPVNEEKIVRPGSRGFMAAILPQGHRAISVRISAATGAGGFILPNDRVDVLVSRKQKLEGVKDEVTISELVLSNVRVLAIDQTITEGKDGEQVVVGKTATLELKPKQAEVLARVETSGQLTLTLRSLADSSPKGLDDDGPRLSPVYANGRGSNEIKVYRYGVQSLTAAKK